MPIKYYKSQLCSSLEQLKTHSSLLQPRNSIISSTSDN